LNLDDIIDIELNGKIYYAFYDLEDGNYLAVDKNLVFYTLIHDEEQMVTKLKTSFKKIITDIARNQFDVSNYFGGKNASR
jgi:hypothetical protein